VLYPVAVHFKGSGFYTTDYGRGKRSKGDESKDKDGAKPETKESKPEKKEKAAEA